MPAQSMEMPQMNMVAQPQTEQPVRTLLAPVPCIVLQTSHAPETYLSLNSLDLQKAEEPMSMSLRGGGLCECCEVSVPHYLNTDSPIDRSSYSAAVPSTPSAAASARRRSSRPSMMPKRADRGPSNIELIYVRFERSTMMDTRTNDPAGLGRFGS